MHSIVGPDLKANNLLVFMGMGKHDSYEGDSNHNTERECRDTFDFRYANYHIAWFQWFVRKLGVGSSANVWLEQEQHGCKNNVHVAIVTICSL